MKIREVEAFHQKIHKEILRQIDAKDRPGVLPTLETLFNSMKSVKQRLVVNPFE